jgi:electron transfer flavoprotein alpha subunit
MPKIGILIETTADGIKPTLYGVITAARGPEHELYGFVFDGKASEYQDELQTYGIHKIVDIQSEKGPLSWNPDCWARAVVEALHHFGIDILIGLTSFQTKDVFPRIASILDAPLLLDCIRVDLKTLTAEKSQFSGKTVATFKLRGTHYLFGIRPNVISAAPSPVTGELLSFQTKISERSLTVEGVKKDASGALDLAEAAIIISGGRAMQNSENYRILHECAQVLGAAVGASRVAVDAGWVPHSMQVGQTGTTVSPHLYIACGISGSVQHFAGMKTAQVVVAINTDPQAAMMQQCDYGIVGDLFKVVPILTRQLKAALNRE